MKSVLPPHSKTLVNHCGVQLQRGHEAGEKDTGPQESKQLCSRLLADGLLSFQSTLEHCLAPFFKNIVTSTSSGLLIRYEPPARTQGVSCSDRRILRFLPSHVM